VVTREMDLPTETEERREQPSGTEHARTFVDESDGTEGHWWAIGGFRSMR